MRFTIIFVAAICILAAFSGQTTASPAWKGWKEIEKAGRRVFKAAEKALPVVAGYAALSKGK
uniref:Antimicrobial peptide cecropin B2 n=1 Tax=Calomera littoralis TaxID=285225 RepID=A0A6G6C458_CALLO|nr:antimicrobial peptide cecropin B2 [Calomera littoralis]